MSSQSIGVRVDFSSLVRCHSLDVPLNITLSDGLLVMALMSSQAPVSCLNQNRPTGGLCSV